MNYESISERNKDDNDSIINREKKKFITILINCMVNITSNLAAAYGLAFASFIWILSFKQRKNIPQAHKKLSQACL